MFDLTEGDAVLNREPIDNRMNVISKEFTSMEVVSISAIQKVDDLHVWVGKLKNDIQLVLARIEHNVDMFKIILSDKLKLILNMLSEKQLLMQMTLDECYSVIGDLVEFFLSIGYDSENDITNLMMKVDNLEKEMKWISECVQLNKSDHNLDKSLWFINHDNKLIVSKDVSVGSILPKFNFGDASERKQFLTSMIQVFSYNKVPEQAWVRLTTSQLTEAAHEWWRNNETTSLITWSKFTEMFMNAEFDSGKSTISNRSLSDDYKGRILVPVSHEKILN